MFTKQARLMLTFRARNRSPVAAGERAKVITLHRPRVYRGTRGSGVLRRIDVVDVLARLSLAAEVRQPEPPLRLGEVAQRRLVGVVLLLGEAFEEIDHLRRRLVVRRRRDDLLARRRILDLAQVLGRAERRVLSDSSGHVENVDTAPRGCETRPARRPPGRHRSSNLAPPGCSLLGSGGPTVGAKTLADRPESLAKRGFGGWHDLR